MSLIIIQDQTPDIFLSEAGPLLYQDEASSGLMLGLCGNLARAKEPPKQTPIFLRVLKNGQTVSAAVQAPPNNLVLTFGQRDELELLAKQLKTINAQFAGVVGPAHEAQLFAQIWSKLSGLSYKLGMGQKIYKIETVLIPDIPGTLYVAHAKDVDLVTQWIMEFVQESLPPNEHQPFEERKAKVIQAIENQWAHLWMVEGVPVSIAHVGRPTKNSISVSGVYTPKQLRGKGYASAVTAHLSQKMLDEGKKFCVLYTDLANSTSNKIYREIGYREVSDSNYYLFV